MTVYDYIVALRYTEIQSTIVNSRPIEFNRSSENNTMDVTSLFTGEVLVTFNADNEVTYASDLVWLTSKYVVPVNNEYIETYTKYIPDMDVTVIFQDTWACIDNHVELCQRDVTGYYYGEPSENLTNMYKSEVTIMDRFNAPKYDVSVFPEPNYPQNKYIIMYNGVKWLLNYRGPGFYDKLGTYDTKELAYEAYIEHRKQKLQEMLNNEYS